MHLKDRLAFAADLPLNESLSIFGHIAPHVGWAKVGLSLFVEHGPTAVRAFQGLGAKVFLDLKLHDIPNTVEGAARNAARLGVGLLTVHASGGESMLKAALRGALEGAQDAKCAPPRILAVTVLTSMKPEELQAVGVSASPEGQVAKLARLAQQAGIDGVVCSAREAALLRGTLGPSAFLCTPGIRPDGAATHDQTRVETPAAAIAAGSNLLVVGRPLYEASSPAEASRAILLEMQSALSR